MHGITAAAGTLLMLAQAGSSATPIDPAAAIRLADTGHVQGTRAQVELPVVSAARGRDAVFLNSAADYRSPDNFSFRIGLAAAKKLEKRYGAPLDRTMVGRRVTATGIVRGSPVYTAVGGRPHSFVRVAYSLNVDQANQVTAVR